MSGLNLFISSSVLLGLLIHITLCANDVSLFKKKHIYATTADVDVSFLQQEWTKGDVDAGGELTFASALGLGTEQNLQEAIVNSNFLASLGVARAHTTLALLLHHNLTESELSKDEREKKALANYISAAIKGDPLAQIITGEDYYLRGDCHSAVNYYQEAAATAIENILEMDIFIPSLTHYIWDEDSFYPESLFPSQEQLDFYEHVAVNGGEADAALKAATILISGTHEIRKDVDKAHRFLKQAVRANNTIAMVFLGQMYLRGIVEGDDFEAYTLLETALKYGNELAHSGIGRIYMEGKAGKTRDLTQAEYHFKKGIEAGNIDSFYQLGKLYYLNDGPGNFVDALELWKVPAMIGHVHSAWCLAQHYYSEFFKATSTFAGGHSNTEVGTKVCENSLMFYRLVALAGNWGDLLHDAFKDYSLGKKGASLLKYLLLSDLGYNAAHVNAARILEEGDNGLYKEEKSAKEKGAEMWSRTAKSGVARGYLKLGDYYYYGLGENAQNYTIAAEYYRTAALMGDAEGGFSLALITEWGEGVEQDIVKAVIIFNEVAEKNADAKVPVALALLRLYTFSVVKEYLGVNLYLWDWDPTPRLKEFVEIINKYLIQWDILAMLGLCVLIIASLRMRIR